jgi:hypothetical protein
MKTIGIVGRVVVGLVLVLSGCSSDGGPTSEGGGSAASDASGGKPSGAAGGGAPAGGTTAPGDGSYISTRMTLPTKSSAFAPGMATTSLVLGGTTAASLTSMKYFIKSIVICEDMETNGTGTGNSRGCLSIYSVPEDPAYAYTPQDADFTHLADTARKSDVGFIDLMDATSRAKLTTDTRLSKEHVHAYNYGAIYWNLPIKLTAAIPMADGSTYYTHDGPTVRTPMGSGDFVAYPTVTSSSLTEGPAEEATILHPNGGTWFKFQAPLVVTQKDLDDKVGYVLDLTFNPDGLVKGASWGGPPPSIVEGGAEPRTIVVPMLDLTPVPHRATESVMKETYVANVKAGADDFDVRLELYSVKGDPKKTIYGASGKTLVNARSITSVSEFQKVAFLDAKDSGVIDFQAYDRSVMLSGFSRREVEGDTVSATLHCARYGDPAGGSAGVLFAGCQPGGMPITFTLASVSPL